MQEFMLALHIARYALNNKILTSSRYDKEIRDLFWLVYDDLKNKPVYKIPFDGK
jgi:hypothetical protein